MFVGLSRKFAFVAAAVAFLALPHALSAGGVCEDLCGECYFSPTVECAYLDGCKESENECYFLSGECPECPPV